MRGICAGLVASLVLAIQFATSPLFAQQSPGAFHWIDFHSPEDQSVVIWVTRALEPEKWTAIREIGVEYDAALVVTTLRANPQSPASGDTFSVWSVSLTTHLVTPLFKGVNLRWLDWMRFAEGKPLEPAVLYDNCKDCPADTYFTSFHYDVTQHMWTARWMNGGQGIHVWSAHTPGGVELSQVYAVLADPNGVELVSTWLHFDYGDEKPAQDYIYQYDLDPWSGLERTQQLNGKQADAMKVRLCKGDDAVAGLERGQDSAACTPKPKAKVQRPARHATSSPPADHSGQSVPPGSHPTAPKQ
ncbi:MAG TPA: hypothetical protein VKR52_07025 [Terracidiphilus sp.]|nr:hypothetical protein [Terracidiphilus sp.]